MGAIAMLAAARAGAATTSVLEVRGSIDEIEVADLDGDGANDVLIFGSRTGEDGGPERFLAAFLHEGGRFERSPSVEVRVPKDVVMAGVAHVFPEPGEQVFLFTPRAIYGLDLFAKSEAARFRKLASCESFFFYASAKELPAWDLLGDLDGDGKTEVLVPVAEGALAIFRPSADGRALVEERRLDLGQGGDLVVDGRTAHRGHGASFSAGSGGASLDLGDLYGSTRTSFLFGRSRTAGRPYLLDLDGDGHAELVLGQATMEYKDERIKVTAEPGPSAVEGLSAKGSELWKNARFKEPKRSGHMIFRDLDGDHLIDCIRAENEVGEETATVEVLHGQIATETGTATRVFSFRPPSQELKIDGLISDMDLADVDGDGRDDLVVVSARLDVFAAAAAASAPESIDVRYSVFLGEKDGTFGRKRALGGAVPLKLTSGSLSAAGQPIRFDADYCGCGHPDALIWETTGRVHAHRVVRETGLLSGGGLALADAPIFDVAAPDARNVFPVDLGGKARALAIVYRSKLEVREP